MHTTPTVVPGFQFAGRACGIKENGAMDLGLVYAPDGAAVAGLFTKNQVRAAPVVLSEARIERGRTMGLLVNSGNANACTGEAGYKDALYLTSTVAEELGIDREDVLNASTGVIGRPLPTAQMTSAIPDLIADLSESHALNFAQAILTTDRWTKVRHSTVNYGNNRSVQIMGIAKGAGMIHPQLATTLVFLFTDAPASSSFLRSALRKATDSSFNRLSVDGDTSTNDSIFALASANAVCPPLQASQPDGSRFIDCLSKIMDELAHEVVRDGEGARHVVRFEVTEAPSQDAAQKLVETIARSLLVRTMIHGRSPNWGRILAAAGNAGVRFDPNKVELCFDGQPILRPGLLCTASAEEKARIVMKQSQYSISLKLGQGNCRAHYLCCDIGTDYITLNAE